MTPKPTRRDCCWGGLSQNTVLDMPPELLQALRQSAAGPIDADSKRTGVAIATHEGFLVNRHLGEAEQLRVYQPADGDWALSETRPTPPAGGGEQRWEAMAEQFDDCHTILCAGAGPSPIRALREQGLRVIVMEGLVAEGLEALANGREIRAPLHAHSCGSGCAGDGRGCG